MTMMTDNEKYLRAYRNVQRDMDYIDPAMLTRSVDAWAKKSADIRQRLKLVTHTLLKRR